MRSKFLAHLFHRAGSNTASTRGRCGLSIPRRALRVAKANGALYQVGAGTVANQKRHAYVKSAASIQLLPIIAMNTFRPCVPKSLIPSPRPPKSRNLDQYEKVSQKTV